MLRRRNRAESEHGQALILFALSLVLILAFAGIVVDLGVLRNDRQILVNTMDSAALAGGTLLPVSSSTYQADVNLIQATVKADYPGLPLPTIANGGIAYRCLIGVASGQADLTQVTAGVCDPSSSLGRSPTVSDFTGAGPTRSSACVPSSGDKCNVVAVSASATTQYGFGPVVGVNSGSTGTVMSAACNGPCGATPIAPTDLVVIIDRTASMSASDVQATRDAADAVLEVYNPAYQRVALGLLGPSSTSSTCSGVALGGGVKALTGSSGYGTGIPANLSSWVPVGLSGTDSGTPAPAYKEAYSTGTTQPYTLASPSTSHIVAAINCFDHPGGTGTNLATPILMAQAVLNADTRPNVIKGILLETDGQPNYGVGSQTDYTCLQANTNATNVKATGIKIYTVGFGLDAGNDVACPDSSGAFRGLNATQLLASMASQNSTDKNKVGGQSGCWPADNPPAYPGYNDYFFCEPKTETAQDTQNLQTVFKYVAINLASGGLHLVQLYPTPIVSSISGGASVTINGEFFTGVTSVTFGGTPAKAFTFVSDTSITATPPAGTSGTTVDVQVTTAGGGSSPITSHDQYKYP
ncbi:MAG: VWA domain-containing protein [Candidatus Limnocylindrales bacterium]